MAQIEWTTSGQRIGGAIARKAANDWASGILDLPIDFVPILASGGQT